MNKFRFSILIAIWLLLTACAAGLIERQNDVFRLSIAGENWIIEFPAREFTINIADNSKPYYHFTSDKLAVSFNFDRTTKCNDSRSCRDYLSSRKQAAYPHKKNWRMSQIDEVFVSEEMDGPQEGFDLRQQHMNAHYVKNGIWIDVHLSKVDYRDSDRELFVKFVRSIRFGEK